jgi:uncharacterized protein
MQLSKQADTMKRIYFNARDGITLEGILHGHPEEKAPAAVITHPHPLYGGTMDNYVLDTVASAFVEKGYTTLRFNFRGVGDSDGRFSDGRGELEDVIGALDYVRNNGARQIVLAGYSFGAWVNAHVPSELQPDQMAMISPPVAMLDFSGVGAISSLKLVITGEKDDIAPPSTIKKLLATWNPDTVFRVLGNTDHFYGSSLPALKSILQEELG